MVARFEDGGAGKVGVGHRFGHKETEFFQLPLGIDDFEAKKLGLWTNP